MSDEAGAVRDTSNINVSGDTVKMVLSEQVKRGDITAEQEGLVWWFFCHCKTEGYTLKEAGALIEKDSTAISRVWNGKYGASLDNICQDIARYRKLSEERATRVHLDFIETSIWRTIDKVCSAALVTQTVAFIWGDSQIGKTTALEEHARRNNHGQTKLVRMPASAGVQLFMKELARACFVSPDSCFEKLRDRVLNAIDDRTLVIVDELHQAFTSYQSGSAIKVMEVIREIYDRTHCGLVLCGTNVLRDNLTTGKLAAILEQLRRRGTIKVQLPKCPPKSDLDRIAKKFGLSPAVDIAAEVVKDQIHTSGLGMYIKFLQSAGMMANKEGRKLTWDHFVQAHDIIARLSQIQKREE